MKPILSAALLLTFGVVVIAEEDLAVLTDRTDCGIYLMQKRDQCLE